jgi:outer membrane murein-binding lipoprotein Lpp
MLQVTRGFARLSVVGAVVLGGLSLSACATQQYVDQRIAEVNTHLSAVDAKATAADQKADAAMSAAQAAQASATQANQRIDALTTQVNSIQQTQTTRAPRG